MSNSVSVDSKKFRAQCWRCPSGATARPWWCSSRCGRGSKTVEWLVRRLKPKRLAFELKAMRFTLKKMRMRKLFSSTADLTNFAPDGGLLVNGAIHKALIQVDEGVQTAAATASVLKDANVNRPFVFYIKDNESNNILSMGVYRGP
ncbi:putative serine proteinase inhibitor [Penaeus vannamei]|uniref:Putative serine proteinase inhibitor n=1 Tax=Penaeus vannamei TaxID=6689 RepID=A0A3R7M117_PENVA|nr:putative serine proteinase inhibitor [Penaeus vannamei]